MKGVELRSLRARVRTEMNMSRALGAGDLPPVEAIDWYLEVDADADPETLEEIKAISDERCPGAYCIKNPIELRTHLEVTGLPRPASRAGPVSLSGLSRYRLSTETGQHLPNRVVALDRVAHRRVPIEPVAVTAPHLLLAQVAIVDQVVDDPLGSPFGNADFGCEIPKPGLGVPGEVDHHVAVIGQEGPVGHDYILGRT